MLETRPRKDLVDPLVLSILSATELATGNVDLSQHALQPAEWLHYQYYQSPALLNTLESVGEAASDLADALHAEYARTIAIVSPSGIHYRISRYQQDTHPHRF